MGSTLVSFFKFPLRTSILNSRSFQNIFPQYLTSQRSPILSYYISQWCRKEPQFFEEVYLHNQMSQKFLPLKRFFLLRFFGTLGRYISAFAYNAKSFAIDCVVFLLAFECNAKCFAVAFLYLFLLPLVNVFEQMEVIFIFFSDWCFKR